MAKTERRRKAVRFPKEIELAIRAAEDKKAQDITVLGGRTMLVAVTLFSAGYLALERKYGAMWLVGVAVGGGGVISIAM